MGENFKKILKLFKAYTQLISSNNHSSYSDSLWARKLGP